jgi:NCS2 family nucleobase:cation symporter-2
VGLIPVAEPDFCEHFPAGCEVIFGSSITSTVIVVFIVNVVFSQWARRPRMSTR